MWLAAVWAGGRIRTDFLTAFLAFNERDDRSPSQSIQSFLGFYHPRLNWIVTVSPYCADLNDENDCGVELRGTILRPEHEQSADRRLDE
jgi:hypothetical protein